MEAIFAAYSIQTDSFVCFQTNQPESIAMKYKAIHQALRDTGLTWKMTAEAIGCTPHHLMNVSARRCESRPAAVALAALIERDVAEIFSDVPRYQEDQKQIRSDRVRAAKEKLESAGLRMVG